MSDSEITRHFDNIFGTKTSKNIKFKDMKLLQALIEYFGEDLYTPSAEYDKLRSKHIKISDELQATFTKEQQELFYEYEKLENSMSQELEYQLFMFGYIVCSELNAEVKKALNKDTNI